MRQVTATCGRPANSLDRDGVLAETIARDGDGVPTPPRSLAELRLPPGVADWPSRRGS